MNAATQYKLGAADLETVLAMVRTGTLAPAGERLGVDASTVFRALQRIERGLGTALFERSRAGYHATELAEALAEQAERVETALETARAAVQAAPEQLAGLVRITTTDSVLHGLVAPALQALRERHPLLRYELHAGNEIASLTRRDADIAVRATKRPPLHLVGQRIGPIRIALYAAAAGASLADVEAGRAPWIAPDEALPEHPSVLWRRKRFPKVVPTYSVNSLVTVLTFVEQGWGVGVLPMFLAEGRPALQRLDVAGDESLSDLWLLTHPEARHLRRVGTVYQHLARAMVLV